MLYQDDLLETLGRRKSVSKVRVAFAAVATALHCERSCAGENVSVTQIHASVGKDVIKPGDSKLST